jgi:hypothetical protein
MRCDEIALLVHAPGIRRDFSGQEAALRRSDLSGDSSSSEHDIKVGPFGQAASRLALRAATGDDMGEIVKRWRDRTSF